MSRSIQVAIKFRLGEQLKQGFAGLTFGKYNFSPLPSEFTGNYKSEMLLNFEDDWVEGQHGSNPEKEGEIVLSWLSMILRQKLKVSSSRLNNVQIQMDNKEIIVFESPIDFPDNLSEIYIKFKSLPLDKLERYVRACECYQEALLLSTANSTISFFLLVVCIECLSSKDDDFYSYLMKEISSKKDVSKKDVSKKDVSKKDVSKKDVSKKDVSKKDIKDIYDKFKEEYGASETPHSKLLPAGKSAYGRSGASDDDTKLTSLSWSVFLP